MNDKKRSCLYASVLFWFLISVCASLFLIWCAKKAYGFLAPKQILFLEALVVLSLVLHLKHETDQQIVSGKPSSAGNTAKSIFSYRHPWFYEYQFPSYDIRYDYIRLFAVFCVILLHCLGIAMPMLSMEINEETLAMLREVPRFSSVRLLCCRPASIWETPAFSC